MTHSEASCTIMHFMINSLQAHLQLQAALHAPQGHLRLQHPGVGKLDVARLGGW